MPNDDVGKGFQICYSCQFGISSISRLSTAKVDRHNILKKKQMKATHAKMSQKGAWLTSLQNPNQLINHLQPP
jgi:hypothetical protein